MPKIYFFDIGVMPYHHGEKMEHTARELVRHWLKFDHICQVTIETMNKRKSMPKKEKEKVLVTPVATPWVMNRPVKNHPRFTTTPNCSPFPFFPDSDPKAAGKARKEFEKQIDLFSIFRPCMVGEWTYGVPSEIETYVLDTV
jgi:hypothetical protein